MKRQLCYRNNNKILEALGVPLKALVKRLFEIDKRALETFRIGMGLILLAEVWTKASSILEHYSDLGIFPRATAMNQMNAYTFSFNLMNGSVSFQILIFAALTLAALSIILGYRTKLTWFIAWILLVSIHGRNYVILNAGDALIRVMMFWGLFLPLGRRDDSKTYFGAGSVAAFLQLTSIYFFTVIFKDHPIWNRDFTAVYYALNLEQFTTPLGHWLRNFPSLLKLLTISTYWLEWIGPFLLFSPIFTWQIRLLVVPAFISLHFGFFLTMNIGMFPWICMLAWMLFLPKEFWDALPSQWKIPSFALRSRPLPRWPQASATLACSVCLIGMLSWNLQTLPSLGFRVPEPMKALVLSLRLDQRWNMFAPFPMKFDSWLVIPGKLANGQTINVLDGTSEVNWDKPADLSEHLGNTQWRKYFTNVWFNGTNPRLKLQYGKFLCRRWNRLQHHHNEQSLISYQIYMMRELTPAPGQPAAPVKKTLVWSHRCFGNERTVLPVAGGK